MNVRIRPLDGWAGSYVRQYDSLTVGTIISLSDGMYLVTGMVASIEPDVDFLVTIDAYVSRWPGTKGH